MERDYRHATWPHTSQQVRVGLQLICVALLSFLIVDYITWQFQGLFFISLGARLFFIAVLLPMIRLASGPPRIQLFDISIFSLVLVSFLGLAVLVVAREGDVVVYWTVLLVIFGSYLFFSDNNLLRVAAVAGFGTVCVVLITIVFNRPLLVDSVRLSLYLLLTHLLGFTSANRHAATRRKQYTNFLAQKILATLDSLTGLANRRHFMDLAERTFELGQRTHAVFCVLMMDVDHFKRVNDSFGHSTGDDVLRTLSREISTLIRKTDVFARLGGEEFAILLPDTDLEGARVVADKIRHVVASIPWTQANLKCTISIGVAALSPNDGNFSQLLQRADAALYEAKELGRDRTAVAS